MIHFLLVFDHDKSELVSQEQFDDPKAAADAYSKAERAHHDEPRIEIVLVGADSIETIHQTHGHYFAPDSNPSKYLTGV